MLKRVFDIIVSFIALIIFSPLIILIASLVKIKLGSPILFKQVRPGYHGIGFEMVKFRSMLDKMDKNGTELPDKERLTAFGKILRASSLDELPELWAVLKGDMSLVGPRPLLMEYLPLYSEEQMHRHDVLPGITGWAQVNGRNALSWNDKFKYDVWYVNNQSFWLDIKILMMTIKKVLNRDGISSSADMTTEKFKGNIF